MDTAANGTMEELRLRHQFENVRNLLLSEKYSHYMDTPLVYWTLPTDRRLPFALLGRSLGNLLSTSFADLNATPGVGKKKILSFVTLLSRVANTNPLIDIRKSSEPSDLRIPCKYRASVGRPGTTTYETVSNWTTDRNVPQNIEEQVAKQKKLGNHFDPSAVSEVVWSEWCTNVLKSGLGAETIGRFTTSLKDVTRVLWNTTLESYAHMSLQEIRSMRVHGGKRIRSILQAFYNAHESIAKVTEGEDFTVRILPRSIDKMERWLGQTMQTSGIPSAKEIRRCFVCPLLDQIQIDASDQIISLAEKRLGMTGPITSLRQTARIVGLTRARAYQLLNEINDIMVVRWPLGRWQLYCLKQKLEAEVGQFDLPPDLAQFHAAVEMCYPGCRRGAAGPVNAISVPTSGNGHANIRGNAVTEKGFDSAFREGSSQTTRKRLNKTA